MRRGGLFGVIRRRDVATGVLAVAVFGVRGVVGMGGVFVRVLVVGMLVMGVVVMRFRR